MPKSPKEIRLEKEAKALRKNLEKRKLQQAKMAAGKGKKQAGK